MGDFVKCMICNKQIITKVTWENLFREKNYLVCTNCFYKYPIKMTYQAIPINNGFLDVFSLFDRKYHFNPNAFLLELSELFRYVSKKYDLNENILFYYDDFEDVIEKIDELEQVSMVAKVVIITTFI